MSHNSPKPYMINALFNVLPPAPPSSAETDSTSSAELANVARQRAAAAKSRARLKARIQLGRLPALPASPPPVSTTPVGSPPPSPTTLPPHPTQAIPTPVDPIPIAHMANPDQHRQSTPNKDFMQLMMETQHQSMLQAQSERTAAAACMACLEEAILLLSLKTEEAPHTATPSHVTPGRFNLQRFQTTDGPCYKGPFQQVEPFLKWIHAVKVFFATKGVSHDADKIHIVGSLIWEINTLTFYSNGVEGFVQGSWAEFKNFLFAFALTPLWQTKLRDRIQPLEMKDSKAFLMYSTRACMTLQSMVNFDNPTFSNFSLAEFVVLGLPLKLKALVNNFQIMLTGLDSGRPKGRVPTPARPPLHAARRPHAYKWREDGRLGVRPRRTGVLAMHACPEGVQALHALWTGVHGRHACARPPDRRAGSALLSGRVARHMHAY
ncbi:hypothetical protein PCASD_25541 [Puccinia coronata f. sp. avenae]|uniref:Uncharacterized protein n=1 Tax=Puccinia coronata f. sp. avenae TaxID=200324 RepID=A0A2N5TMD2_9BASI|nr:hypothetical protein PCASD_25541 [Puccinia coronata f. sp. avenae]